MAGSPKYPTEEKRPKVKVKKQIWFLSDAVKSGKINQIKKAELNLGQLEGSPTFFRICGCSSVT
jgi:hypothetical protein